MGFIQFPFITPPTYVLQTYLIILTSGASIQIQTLSCDPTQRSQHTIRLAHAYI